MSTKISFELEILTPLSIGGNKAEKLYPFIDYLIDDDAVLYINPREFRQHLTPELAGKLADGVLLDPKFSLKNFIRMDMGIQDLQKVTRKIPQKGLQIEKREPVQTILKTQGKPYIPGTTLKGALRTAIFYNWLIKPGNSRLNEWMDQLKSGKFNIDVALAESSLMGEAGKNAPENRPVDAHLIRLSDSAPFLASDLMVISSKRIHLMGKDKTAIPTPREAIAENKKSTFILEISSSLNHADLSDWNKNPQKKFCEALNTFSKDFIAMEREVLQQHAPGSQISQWYENISLDVLPSLSEKKVLLRLGAGKTYFNNSVGLAIYKRDKALFKTFLTNTKEHKTAADLFPRTRTVGPTGQPLGWVKITSKT